MPGWRNGRRCGLKILQYGFLPNATSWSNFPYFSLDVKLGGAQVEVSIATEWTRSREAGHPISEAGMFAAAYCYNFTPV
jgi:hypothetical protein